MKTNRYFLLVIVLYLIIPILLFQHIGNFNVANQIIFYIWITSFLSFAFRNTIFFTFSKTTAGVMSFLIFFQHLSFNIYPIFAFILSFLIYILMFIPSLQSYCLNGNIKDQLRVSMSIPISHSVVTLTSNILCSYFIYNALDETTLISRIIYLTCSSAIFYFSFALLYTFLKRVIIFVPRGVVLIDSLFFNAPIRIEKAELSLEDTDFIKNPKGVKNITLGCKRFCYLLKIENAFVEDKSDASINKIFFSVNTKLSDLN